MSKIKFVTTLATSLACFALSAGEIAKPVEFPSKHTLETYTSYHYSNPRVNAPYGYRYDIQSHYYGLGLAYEYKDTTQFFFSTDNFIGRGSCETTVTPKFGVRMKYRYHPYHAETLNLFGYEWAFNFAKPTQVRVFGGMGLSYDKADKRCCDFRVVNNYFDVGSSISADFSAHFRASFSLSSTIGILEYGSGKFGHYKQNLLKEHKIGYKASVPLKWTVPFYDRVSLILEPTFATNDIDTSWGVFSVATKLVAAF